MIIDDLISDIRAFLEDETGTKIYSPDLPQNDTNIACIRVQSGECIDSLNGDTLYYDIPMYLLVRGTTNDKETRQLVGDIFDTLKDIKDDFEADYIHIVGISLRTPNYAYRDDNSNIHYNIDINIKVQWLETTN